MFMTTTGVGARRARGVTYGTIALLLVAALVHLDAWPVSAYRLFSNVRGPSGVSLTLVAVAPDGVRTDVRVPSDEDPLTTTGHLYDDLPRVAPERAVAMVRAWLGMAGIDPAAVDHVDLERRPWVTDPATLDRTYGATELVLAVEP
jgi:hypothetical protein